MDENRFRELLLENNELNEKRTRELLLENNEYLLEKMDEKIKDNNEYLLEKMDGKIKESEKRQNEKLAYMEHTYGNKIDAIFDKVSVIEEAMINMKSDIVKNQNSISKHDDILFSHDFRIAQLERESNS